MISSTTQKDYIRLSIIKYLKKCIIKLSII